MFAFFCFAKRIDRTFIIFVTNVIDAQPSLGFSEDYHSLVNIDRLDIEEEYFPRDKISNEKIIWILSRRGFQCCMAF